MILLAFLSLACSHAPPTTSAPKDQKASANFVQDFQAYWLHEARIAPPTISFEPQRIEDNSLTAEIRPIRAESQPWNTWPGEGFRLFNNRSAYLFFVQVQGPGSLRWVPEDTILHLNTDDIDLAPASTAEHLLQPLRETAVIQEKAFLDGDLTRRLRGATEFRQAYLPKDSRTNTLTGVIAFPVQHPKGHVQALQVQIMIETSKGKQRLTWVFE